MRFIREEDINKLLADYLSSDFNEDSSEITVGCEKMALATINAYIGNKYDLEFMFNKIDDNRDFKLVELAIDITIYNVAGRYGRMTDQIENRFNKAIEFLKDVATGKVSPNWAKLNSDFTKVSGFKGSSVGKFMNDINF